MIYLQRYTGGADSAEDIEIVAVEDEQSATAYETRGYRQCSFEAFREAWRLRDLRSLEQLRAAYQEAAANRSGVYSAPN